MDTRSCTSVVYLQILTTFVLIFLVASGCQTPFVNSFLTAVSTEDLEEQFSGVSDLSVSSSHLETIPLEFTFLRYAEEDIELGDELWNVIDEQCLPTSLRHRLNGNGIRAGVIRGDIPAALAKRFASTFDTALGEADDSPLAADRTVVKRVIQTLPGRTNEIVSTPRLEELILLEHDSRSTVDTLSGQTYRDASAIFDVRATPSADGGIEIELIPLIRHGPIERNWTGDDGAFRLEAGQRKTVMNKLELTLPLPADGTLVLSSVGPPSSGLGDAFFRDPQGRHEGRRLLAIRSMTRTVDPMFSEGSVIHSRD